MEREIKKGDTLYYLGIGWGSETQVFNIVEGENGKKIVHANNGVKRDYEKVITNTCDLFTSKEEINKHLAKSWMAKLIP